MFRIAPTTKPSCTNAAKNYAFNALSRRSYSRCELARRLRRKGFTEHVCQDVMRLVEEYGYIDDLELAKRELERCFQQKGLGPRRIQLRLRQRGIASEIIDEVLGSINIEAIYDLCLKEARKKLRQLSELDDITKRSRLSAFLYRRGFESDCISRCLRELIICN